MSWYVAATFSLLASAIILSQPDLFINLFTGKLGYEDGHELRLLMPTMLLLSAIFLFLDTLDGNLLALAAGIQDTAVAMWIKLFTSWIIGISLTYYLGVIREFGVVGLWSGWTISVFLAVVLREIHFEIAIRKLTSNMGSSPSER
jgi:multidrug resistance protein, MATE family